MRATRDSYIPESYGAQVQVAAGPHDGKIIFTDGRSIFGVKLANKTTVHYNEGLSNGIARFELIGHGMYVAQTDGRFVAISLKGKLIAFNEPQSLKM